MKIGTRITKLLLSTTLCVAAFVLVNTPHTACAKSELTTTFTDDAGQWWWPINGKTIRDAREALATLKAKIKARDEAKEKLAEAHDKLSTALTAIALSGGKQTPSQTKQLEKLRAEIAKAEAALEKAEAELLAARVALEKAISELADGKEKDELIRQRDYLYTVAFPQNQVRAENGQFNATDTLSGIVTVEMKTDQGPIMLRLPADARAGDTISGTVVDERKGPTDEVSAVEINGQLHKLSNKILTFVVPKAGQVYSFVAKNGSGREIARGQAPKGFATNAFPHNAIPTAGSNFNAQTGRNLPLAGKFDGVAGTTNATIGGRPAEIVAESQTMTVIGISADTPTGQSTLSLKETGGNSPSNFQSAISIVSVKLKADNLTLTRGQHALATMTVDVGQNPKATVPVQVSCSGGVNMQGGNLQTIQIQPSQVSSDGTFTQTFAADRDASRNVQRQGDSYAAKYNGGQFEVQMQM